METSPRGTVYNYKVVEKKWSSRWEEKDWVKNEHPGDLPAFSMVLPAINLNCPQSMRHTLVFTIADIILMRKKMQEFKTIEFLGIDIARGKSQKNISTKQLMGQMKKLFPALYGSSIQLIQINRMNRLATRVFIQLYHEEKIYRTGEKWFLRSSETAYSATEMIKRKKVTFIPLKLEREYSYWLGHLRDWCISQRINGGQRIPVYHCPGCRNIMVAGTKPAECNQCQASGIIQDDASLVSWFSASIWPFGESVYPFTSIVCGYDNFFTWVARMIIIGLLLHKEMPFKDVLVHGAIREASEPFDLIKQYGSEALRFNLAIQASSGRDISISTSKIKGCKAFINKIWNASRYVILNLKGDEDFAIDFFNITDADRWLMHGLNDIIDEANRLMEQYRLHKAALLLYHFFWHEYCDWYLEFSRGDLENRDTRRVLRLSLLKLLHLLHPFMPYITEEIFQTIGAPDNFLIENQFPSFDSQWVFPDEYANIEQLKKIITEIRKMRGEYGIKPRQETIIYLKTGSEKEKRRMAKYLKYFNFLTGSSESGILNSVSDAPRGFKGEHANWEIIISLSHEQDRRCELTRLAQELKRAEDQIAELETKLSNRNHIKKKPAAVTAGLKQKLQAALKRQEKIRKTIHDLS